MEGWKKELLGNLLEINTENIGRNYPFEEINYYDISSVKSGFVDGVETVLLKNAPSRAKRIVKDKDTILSTVRPRNRSFYYFKEAKENDIVSTGFAVLRPDLKKLDDRYLYYLVTDYNFTAFLAANEKGAAYPAVTPEVIARAKILLPPLPTQRKIAKILSAYDDLIENNLKRIKLLEEMAQKTYEEWFVRLKFPGHETAKFDKKTGLPEGWKKVKLGDYIKFIKGKKVEELFDEQIEGTEKVLLLDALEDGKFKFTKIGKHTQTKRGDIMMLMDGARSSYVFYSENGIIGSTMAKIVSKQIPPTLLYHYFKSILGWLQTNNTGAAIPHANKSFINSIQFILPDKIIIDNWNSRIDVINAEVWNLKDTNQHLKEARDILLPRLMTGMIDVDKIELEL